MKCEDGLSDIAIVTVNVVNVAETGDDARHFLQIDENSLDGADVGIPIQTIDPDFSDESSIEHNTSPPYPFYVDTMMQKNRKLINVGTTALLDAELKNLYFYKVLLNKFTALDDPVMASNGKLTVQILI